MLMRWCKRRVAHAWSLASRTHASNFSSTFDFERYGCEMTTECQPWQPWRCRFQLRWLGHRHREWRLYSMPLPATLPADAAAGGAAANAPASASSVNVPRSARCTTSSTGNRICCIESRWRSVTVGRPLLPV